VDSEIYNGHNDNKKKKKKKIKNLKHFFIFFKLGNPISKIFITSITF